MTSLSSDKRATVTLPADDQILIVREFDAPRHLVWKAWTTPELVKRWWSADMGETTLAEIDLRVGGGWRYVMVVGGEEIGFHGEYLELDAPKRMVSTEVYEGMPDGHAVNTATFEDLPEGRTRLTILVQHQSRAHRDGHIASGMEVGMNRAMDYLERVAVSLA